ncbi:MAG: hypothetical protein H6557_17770 [Lewinellaceae bacterium]|nr:hypothetical protein [Phaeodactylibacter sp.]MCB9038462.1 hypothetical protein [Lewinellaceae bacterium]
MEYLNFELRIGARNSGLYPVAVIRSPAGEVSAMVSLPVEEPQFKERLEVIEKSRRSAGTGSGGNKVRGGGEIVVG